MQGEERETKTKRKPNTYHLPSLKLALNIVAIHSSHLHAHQYHPNVSAIAALMELEKGCTVVDKQVHYQLTLIYLQTNNFHAISHAAIVKGAKNHRAFNVTHTHTQTHTISELHMAHSCQ